MIYTILETTFTLFILIMLCMASVAGWFIFFNKLYAYFYRLPTLQAYEDLKDSLKEKTEKVRSLQSQVAKLEQTIFSQKIQILSLKMDKIEEDKKE